MLLLEVVLQEKLDTEVTVLLVWDELETTVELDTCVVVELGSVVLVVLDGGRVDVAELDADVVIVLVELALDEDEVLEDPDESAK